MTTSRWVVLVSVVGALIGWQPAYGAPISMPPGSTVWMKFESNVCPLADGNDCAGSNQPGPNPPNGILQTTFTNGAQSATAYAEILPARVRTFARGATTDGFLYASFQDTYTVAGVAAAPFDITVQLHVTGVVRSIPFPPFGHAILIPNVQAEIGTFSPLSESGGIPLHEGFRVTPFDAGSQASVVFGTESQPTPFEHPVDITASYTKTGVNVGDVFDIGYGVNSAFSRGEIDLLNTGMISFDLPPGVFLTSALAESLVPEPVGFALLAAAGLSLPALWPRHRRLRRRSATI